VNPVSPPSAAVFLGIGANLGRRESSVLAALRKIDGDGVTVIACSSLYETEAVGMGVAPRFINAVAEVHTLLSPLVLLKRLNTIEKEMGRRGGHNVSREIDIDMIARGADVFTTRDLTLPHPRYDERAFVLLPLREIAPGFVCPRTGRSIDRMIELLNGHHGVTRVSGRGLYPRARP
jgi:2-amino-4-hydroxy-6-hydroxymethyldihydropteridine diphosphokinase